jgi:hypothetical protein
MRTITINSSRDVTIEYEVVTEPTQDLLMAPRDAGMIDIQRLHMIHRVTIDGHPFRIALPSITTRGDGASVMHAKSEKTGEEVLLWMASSACL